VYVCMFVCVYVYMCVYVSVSQNTEHVSVKSNKLMQKEIQKRNWVM